MLPLYGKYSTFHLYVTHLKSLTFIWQEPISWDVLHILEICCISVIANHATGMIGNDAVAAPKKAALLNRQGLVQALAVRLDGLAKADGNGFNDTAMFNRLSGVMHGLFKDAYDPRDQKMGTWDAFTPWAAGWLAQESMKSPLAVRVQVFEATLMGVALEALPATTTEAQWQGVTEALRALAKTYAWLNPTVEVGAVSSEQRDFGVFDRLWRLQVPDAAGQWRSPGTELPLAVAELRRLLTGLADPAQGLRFILGNHLMARQAKVPGEIGGLLMCSYRATVAEFLLQ